MKLLRPHIPLEVRCRVAARQLGLRPDLEGDKRMGRLGLLLDAYLQMLATELGCEVSQLHLDHDPALGAREKVFSGLGRHVNYKPEANDPEFLVYRERHAHQVVGRGPREVLSNDLSRATRVLPCAISVLT